MYDIYALFKPCFAEMYVSYAGEKSYISAEIRMVDG